MLTEKDQAAVETAYAKFGLVPDDVRSSVRIFLGYPPLTKAIPDSIIDSTVLGVARIPDSDLLKLSKKGTLSLLSIVRGYRPLFAGFGIFPSQLLNLIKDSKNEEWASADILNLSKKKFRAMHTNTYDRNKKDGLEYVNCIGPSFAARILTFKLIDLPPAR